jgi:hypothetical protein
MLYLNLFIISCILVIITDLTDFFQNIKKLIWGWVFGKGKVYKDFSIKPLGCSLCETFWCGLIYILVMGQFSIMNIGFVVLLSYLTPVIRNGFILIQDFLLRFIEWWYNILHIQ